MPLSKSKKLLNNLLEAEEKLQDIFIAKQSGEAYHSALKKQKDIFRKVVRSDMLMEKNLRGYFKDLTYRVQNKLNWNKYNGELTASVSDWITSDWSDEALNLKVVLTPVLLDLIEAGGNFIEKNSGLDIGWTSESDLAMGFVDKYAFKLTNNLTDVTIDRVRSSLKLSFSLHEDQDTATARLDNVINDLRRSAVIARTETSRAFAAGRLAVGTQIGADRKQWDATLGACSTCQELDGQIVGIDEPYTVSGEEFFTTPAHPNCNCIDNLLMPEEGDSNPTKADPWDTLKNLFDNI